MPAPIDGSEPNPFPPPPPDWRPRELVRAEMAPLEAALRDRIARTARHHGVSVARAAALVLTELQRGWAP